MIRPCFIVGAIRSGTTWLGNLLAAHPEIAAITHKGHQGIVESAFFSHIYGRYGSLNHRSNYLEFSHVVGASDYFQLAGFSTKTLQSLFPSDYGDVFRTMMDAYARENGRQIWIEKTPSHALKIPLIATTYPDAVFIAIRRNVRDMVRSSLGLRLQYHPERINDAVFRKKSIKSALRNYYHINTAIETFRKKQPLRVHVCSYEELLINSEAVLQEILTYLNLEFYPLRSNYSANTSFKNTKHHGELFTEPEKHYLNQNIKVMKRLPYSYYNWKPKMKSKLLRHLGLCENQKLPNWFYKYDLWDDMTEKE